MIRARNRQCGVKPRDTDHVSDGQAKHPLLPLCVREWRPVLAQLLVAWMTWIAAWILTRTRRHLRRGSGPVDPGRGGARALPAAMARGLEERRALAVMVLGGRRRCQQREESA